MVVLTSEKSAMRKKIQLFLIFILFCFIRISNISCKNLIHLETDNTIESIFFFYPFNDYVNTSLATKVSEKEKNLYKIEFDLNSSKSVLLKVNGHIINLFLIPSDTTSIYIYSSEISFGGRKLKINFLDSKNKEGLEYVNLEFQNDIKLALSKIGFYFYSSKNKKEHIILEEMLKIIEQQTVWLEKLIIQQKVSKDYALLLKNDIKVLFLNEFIKTTYDFYIYEMEKPDLYEKGKRLRKDLREILNIKEALVDKSALISEYYFNKSKELFELYPNQDYDLSNFPHEYEFYIYNGLSYKLKMYLIGTGLIKFDNLFFTEDFCDSFTEFIKLFNHEEFNNYMSSKCL